MLIKDWMVTDVLTVDENTSLLQVGKIMKENNIRKLPVVSHGKLLGIITDRDAKDASPSKTTSLDIHELYYLLSEMKVKDVMTKNPITMKESDSLEKAAMIMLENKISGIPVLDDTGHLSGILSETDVLSGFIHATGIKHGAIQYVFTLPDTAGAVTEIVRVLRENNARIISILTSYEDADDKGIKQVAIRVTLPKEENSEKLTDVLAQNFVLVFHAKDELNDLPVKRLLKK
ncbi:MAG: CBS and ACT domain-containing protein [Proteobacteria bacterium]|nr:CBS domain-containing protein [Desulfobulbaceae bacterium]MBU4151964.1 CBS and ACT domain-containing protein [Pseudomonadota bacterium]MDP2107122.1 CBS and ACT domain-containing protein [Desulfobulbaceae bacterium]